MLLKTKGRSIRGGLLRLSGRGAFAECRGEPRPTDDGLGRVIDEIVSKEN
jgi:hypothetical protein